MAKEEQAVETLGGEFISTLLDLRAGAVVDQLGEELRGLATAVRDTAQAGSMTIILKVAPLQAGSGETVTLEAKISTKLPRPALGKTVLFTTPEGTFMRADPRQMRMALDAQKS